MVKNPPSNAGGGGSILGLVTNIPHVVGEGGVGWWGGGAVGCRGAKTQKDNDKKAVGS